MSKNYGIYDSSGEVNRCYSGLNPDDQLASGEAHFELAGDYADRKEWVGHWYDASATAVKDKTATDLSIPDLVSVDDTVSFDVPSNCYIMVNMTKHTSGTVTLDTSASKVSYLVNVCGKLKYTKKVVVKDYKSKRSSEYPSMKDQLDSLYHNGIDGWKAQIKVIKDKHPK